MNRTMQQLAALVGGELVGDGTVSIHSAATIASAGPGQITFLDNDQLTGQLATLRASALVARSAPSGNPIPTIVTKDPLGTFLTIFQHFHGQPPAPVHGIDARACIHPSARLGRDASVHAFVSIGAGSVIGDRCRLLPGVAIGQNCTLGDDVTLYPHAVVYDGCTLGNRVILHANVVVGADGFGYRQQGGKHVKIPQLAGVVIGDDVEVGACSTIDRGTFEATRIGAGTKIDNLVQVGHNCRIGKHNILVSQSGIAGSCTTGDYVVLGGQAGVADHIAIGDGVMIGAKAGVIGNVPAGERLLGIPARPERQAKMSAVNLERVGDLRKDVKLIKEKLGINGAVASGEH